VHRTGLRRGELFLELVDDFADVVLADDMALGEEGRQHEAVAQGVDLARNAAGVGVDAGICARIEDGVVGPADVGEAVLDVAARLLGVERAEVVGGDHALAQLLHLGALHDVAELRLPDQEALQQRMVLELEVGQHAQLLDRRRGEVLRLVDDQQRTLARRGDGHQIGLDRQQQAGLVEIAGRHAEGGGHHAQHVAGVDLGADDVGGDHALGVELLEQAAHDGRLAGTDLAGDDDETLALVQAVL